MALLKIAKMGHPVLFERAQEVENPLDGDIQALIANMLDTLKDADGLGLAAPQVYASKRIIVVAGLNADHEPDDSEPLVLVNPVYDAVGDELVRGIEGCLSIPGIRGIVPRYGQLNYSALDGNGKPVSGSAGGLFARIIQHEVDHLDGVLFPARLENPVDMAFDSERGYLKERMSRGSKSHV
ncbi:MAG: peptide deformylase [Geminicoccaceae bacterium]